MGTALAHTRIRTRMIAATGAVALAILGVAGTARADTTPSAAKAHALTASCPVNTGLVAGGDIDNDGISDIAVGMPKATVSGHTDAGAVDVNLSSGSAQRITETLNDGVQTGDEFGAAVALGTFIPNGQCYGIAVGVPGWEGVGSVQFYAGSGSGVTTDGDFAINGYGQGSRFGSAIAVGDGALYIGAPGYSVDGHANAGAVFEYTWNSLGGFNGYRPRIITENTPGVPGVSETGDEFGASLAATTQGVFVGSPGESVGTLAGAGAVTFLSNGAPTETTSWTQNSAGVPGASEAGDHFGASLATPGGGRDDGPQVMVGVPGEDLGTIKDAGLVQTFTLNASESTYVPGPDYTQNSPGIPGVAEAGDEFGAAVTYGWQLACGVSFDAAVGSPGEDVGTVVNAGSVTVISTDSSCPSKAYTEGGGGLGGALQANAEVGATVSARSASYADDTDSDDVYDFMLVGAPGETVSGTAGAGTVISVRPDTSGGAPAQLQRYTDSGGVSAGEGYGTALSHSVG